MEPDQHYQFEAELWLYAAARAAWCFITVPEDLSQQIRFFSSKSKGFGSVRVSATIGESRWNTSLFPDKASGCYFLPVKASIRKAEHLTVGNKAEVTLSIG